MARGLAPVGVRSAPIRLSRLQILRLLRSRAGASSLATGVTCLQIAGTKKRQTGWRFLSGRERLRACASLVTQGFHLVMIALHAVVLTFNQITNTHQVVLVDFLHGFAVSLQRMIFTAFGFIQHGLFVLAGEHRLHVNPATVQVAADAGGRFWITAH